MATTHPTTTTNAAAPAARSRLNRRDFMRLTGGLAAGFAAGAALTSLTTRAHAQDAAQRPARRPGKRDNELNILCWEGYNTEDVLGPFRKTLPGVKVKAESGTDDPSMINKLRAGETRLWDLINVNQCWARGEMLPENLIVPLNRPRFEPYMEKMMKWFYNSKDGITPFALSPDGRDIIGLVQRFGPNTFVVNTKKISRATAEDQGLPMFLDPKLKNRYGVLAYDNWNVIHLCITAGFDPFRPHTPDEIERFGKTARQIFANTKIISGDLIQLNQALVNGDIDCYFGGGTYTVSTARHEGFSEIRGISPLRGPMHGKGATQWFELTSLVNNPDLSPRASDFLEFVQRPEICKAVAFAEGTYNPVSQMSQPEVFAKFSKQDLDALQWETLEEDMNRSVDYQIIPENDLLTTIYNEAKRTRA
ncbi:MAG: PotD/PotF family extracellular solute-binding protein [Opitutaceae bacterium]|jgi:spermidine/putrescine transport system substrate-binding protein|nr:PotD/PotF family extracellular solute-binding protein [Opitutaceae bacterium]